MAKTRLPVSPVGKGGANHVEDVRLVQSLLNAWLRPRGDTPLTVDGVVGPRTEAAIRAFQQGVTGASDGLVSPGGPTMRALAANYFGAIREGLPLATSQFTGPAAVQPRADILLNDLAALFDALEKVHRKRGPAQAPDVA